jgi:hypothetical protein
MIVSKCETTPAEAAAIVILPKHVTSPVTPNSLIVVLMMMMMASLYYAVHHTQLIVSPNVLYVVSLY